MQADQLLHDMQKVCNHDLPNQLVALQSLLQLLQAEEAQRLSDDGREYIARLVKVAKRTSEMARFLKEIGKLHAYVSKPEAISLDLLSREIQGNLKHRFPDKQFQFTWNWAAATISADYRTITQALYELLGLLAATMGRKCTLSATSALQSPSPPPLSHQGRGEKCMPNTQVRLEFLLASDAQADDNTPHTLPAQTGSPAWEACMEIILARAWLAASDATFDMKAEGSKGCHFTILLPNR